MNLPIYEFELGCLVRVDVLYTDPDTGDPVTPGAVGSEIRDPTGTVTTPEPEEIADGNYRVELDATIPGLWAVRHYSTGVGQAAAEARILISPKGTLP